MLLEATLEFIYLQMPAVILDVPLNTGRICRAYLGGISSEFLLIYKTSNPTV